MRIALLTYSTRPRGGVVHTLALAEALAAQGNAVTVWTIGRGGDTGFYRPVDPGVRVVVVPFTEAAGEDFGPRVVRCVAELGAAFAAAHRAGDRYDVVHAQDCITAGAVLAAATALRPGRLPPLIRTVHHLDHFTTPELVACHERALVEPARHVCVSAAVADELARGWGISATVIPNGVAAQRFAAAAGPAGAAGRARWQAQLGTYVLAVGGIEPRKGSADLVEAMALVQAEQPHLRLVVAGGETLFDHRPYRDRVLARAAELGVEPVLLGVVPDDDLPTLVAAAQVLAFPSTQEGFGLAAMEALAAGVPVVARDLPVLREVFDGCVTFATDPPTLAAALVGPGLPREPGRALAARHTWSAAATAHLALYAADQGRTAGQGSVASA